MSKRKSRRPEVRYCPLVDGDCLREKCAWWDSGRCAVVSIAKAVWSHVVVTEEFLEEKA